MASGFLAHGADVELKRAIEAVEQASCAEIVIAVRRRSARWLHAHATVAVITAFAALGFMLYDAHVFALASIWIDPFVAGAAAAAIVHAIPAAQRALTPDKTKRKAVHRAALIAFHERGVRRTRARTGILVYVSLLERMAEVVADDGVVAEAPADAWRGAIARIDRSVRLGGSETAKAIAALADVLGPCLPAAADDVNELPDDIDDRDDGE